MCFVGHSLDVFEARSYRVNFVDKIKCESLQIKATEKDFHVVLFLTPYKVF